MITIEKKREQQLSHCDRIRQFLTTPAAVGRLFVNICVREILIIAS